MQSIKKLTIFILFLSILVVSGCASRDSTKVDQSANGNSKKEIVIASKPMPEGVILGELLSLLIEENTDITPIRKFELGATPILHEAILNDEIQVYPEYTGTAWLNILKNEPIVDEAKLFVELAKAYQEKYNLTWGPLIGFNNTYTLIVNQETAEKYDLETISDLAAISENLIFGANGDFYEREDGFPTIEKIYGLQFKDTKDINIGLKYQACVENQIQVTIAFTTDGYLSEGKVKILEDDKNVFPSYNAAFVLREDFLEEYPELEEILQLTSGLINDEEMQKMNYDAQVNGKTHEEIAEKFLKDKGLLP